MKNLIVLLTSLLLAGTANAGVAEFTTGDTQAEGWQDFQVAHGCEIITRVHVPNYNGIHGNDTAGQFGHGERDGRGHVITNAVQCVRKSTINDCAKQNRVVSLEHGRDAICGKKCSIGKKPGRGGKADVCVLDKCKEGTHWQSQHQRCVPVKELIDYCKKEHGKQYNLVTRECGTCPAGSFPQDSGCKTLAELNTYCASTNSAFVYGVAQDACVSIFGLRQYCREEFDKGYNKDTAECEVCPVDHFPQESGCVSKANLDKYCEGEYRTSYNPKEDRCWLPRELY